ncbi:GTP cyclohydrolase I type 2, partial [hydrothermal vent metagenome]
MPDVQGRADARQVPIDRVGVKEITYPMRLHTREGGEQHTIAAINMFVSLPHYQKGTHMSRFLEVLNEHTGEPVCPERIPEITKAICERLEAEEAHFEAEFVYFINKPGPVTGQMGLMNYEVSFACTANGETDFVMTVAAPA